jgi:hypothetical protein
MVDIMTRLKLYTLLAVFDFFGILVTAWISMLPELVGWVLIVAVVIPLVEMMSSFPLHEIVHDLLGQS